MLETAVDKRNVIGVVSVVNNSWETLFEDFGKDLYFMDGS